MKCKIMQLDAISVVGCHAMTCHLWYSIRNKKIQFVSRWNDRLPYWLTLQGEHDEAPSGPSRHDFGPIPQPPMKAMRLVK